MMQNINLMKINKARKYILPQRRGGATNTGPWCERIVGMHRIGVQRNVFTLLYYFGRD